MPTSDPSTQTAPAAGPAADPVLLRIQEVAAEAGVTTRAVRYYEELGLLEPAARSDGDYRLFDASDVERIRFIRGLRDDAGFSLAQIGQLLEDEAARERNRERFKASGSRCAVASNRPCCAAARIAPTTSQGSLLSRARPSRTSGGGGAENWNPLPSAKNERAR
jgi:DNA-binding transcriptional MerR regulator